MARNTYTELELARMALGNLSQTPLTSFTEESDIAPHIRRKFPMVRDAVLGAHFWNFATVRTVIAAYAEPDATLTPGATTGDGITFTAGSLGIFDPDMVGQEIRAQETTGKATIAAVVSTEPAANLAIDEAALTPESVAVEFEASAAVFVDPDDVGKLIRNLTGLGLARITTFVDTTHVLATIIKAWPSTDSLEQGDWDLVATDEVTADITEDFESVDPIASGDWRVYNIEPEWGWAYRLTLPTDCLRVQRTLNSERYQVEGGAVVADSETLSILYTQKVTDVTEWPAHFIRAFTAALTAEIAENVTGLANRDQIWAQRAEVAIRRAKLEDGQEGSAPQIGVSELVNARAGVRLGMAR